MHIDTFIKGQNDASPWIINSLNICKTFSWKDTDNEKLFLENLQNEESLNRLKRLSWDSSDITYSYNSNGFRDAEFDNRPCGIALGCSFTEGIGLPVDCSWPSLLSKYTGTHVWNLGSGGGSIETVFRIFDYYVVKLKPQFVCVLMPPFQRFEYKESGGTFSLITSWDLGIGPQFGKDWLSREYNGKENQRKNMLAIQHICQHYKIPLIFNDSYHGMSDSIVSDDYARDLIHPGVTYQQSQAEYMHNQIKNIGIV